MKRNSKNMEHISSSYNKFLDNEEGITPPPPGPHCIAQIPQASKT